MPIDGHVCCHSKCRLPFIVSRSRKTQFRFLFEAQAILLHPFTVCSSFVHEEKRTLSVCKRTKWTKWNCSSMTMPLHLNAYGHVSMRMLLCIFMHVVVCPHGHVPMCTLPCIHAHNLAMCCGPQCRTFYYSGESHVFATTLEGP
jgi:hypothetical protein